MPNSGTQCLIAAARNNSSAGTTYTQKQLTHNFAAPKHGSGADEVVHSNDMTKEGGGLPDFHRDRLENGSSGEYDELGVVCPPHTTEKKIMRRIDLHVLPFISLLYLLAFLDRVNIANAKSFGLTTDLGLGGVEYNTILTIFFVPCKLPFLFILFSFYIFHVVDCCSLRGCLTIYTDVFFEIPSNILLKKLSPRIWLSICGIGFGLVMIFQGLTQNYSGILATRFFLGLFECGMFPGCFYLLGMWYKRGEAQKRFTFFFCSTSLAGAFGGLLASAIGKSKSISSSSSSSPETAGLGSLTLLTVCIVNGLRGYNGWRWIFIIEGAITFIICIGFLFVFPTL